MADLRWSRRDVMRLGLAAMPASLLAACGWDGGKVLRPGLAEVSRINDWVGEHLLPAGRRAWEYVPSARSATMPAYFVSQTMPVLKQPDAWALEVGGEVRKPLRLSLPMLQQMPRLSYTVKHHCVEGWTAIASWTGVPFATIAGLVEPTAAARYVRFDSFDATYFNGWDLASAMHPQTIIAYGWNDQPLPPAHGAPVRLYAPIKLGYKLTKYLTSVTFTRERPGGYWEDQGYPWLGGL